MNRLLFADRGLAAAARRAAIDGHELAEDVAAPDTQPGTLAAILQILRRQANRRHRVDLRLVADLSPAVDDDRCADAAVPANGDIRADDRVRTDGGAFADPGRGVHVRARVDEGGARLDGQQQFGLGDDLAIHGGHGMRLGQPRPRPSQRDLQVEAIAWKDVAAELGVVDAAQRDARAHRRGSPIENQRRRHLGQRLDHQHRRHQRRAREMSLEVVFTDRDVLERHEPVARLVFSDCVDQQRRIAVGDATEKRWEVEGQGTRASCAICQSPEERPGPPGPERVWRRRCSGRAMTSLVRSMPCSAQTRPLCSALNTKWTCLSCATFPTTGSTLRVNSFLHLLRQGLHVLLRVLAQTLQIALLLLDVRRS